MRAIESRLERLETKSSPVAVVRRRVAIIGHDGVTDIAAECKRLHNEGVFMVVILTAREMVAQS
jgi:hypothetical protein